MILKHMQYAWYIIRHKWFVLTACIRRGLWWQGIVHDLSKLRPDEWMPYAEFFYGDHPFERPAYVKADFDRAWLMHQHRNPHHWQHWVLREDSGAVRALRMPDHYAREMVADWEGAGRAITGKNDVKGWYLRNKDKIILHPDTQGLVEEMLKG